MVRPSWSWAQSPREAEEFQSEAATLVGETLVTVLYIDLDYRADEFRGDAKGPRPIRSADEWEKPTWRHPSCDTVDMAVELHTESGRKFTVAWESPGRIEGLGLRGMPAMGTAVSEGADLAVWDVSERSAWVNLIGQDVRTVTLHYEPWGEGAALWCRWITIRVGDTTVEFVLGEALFREPGGIHPSANNIAVLFSPDALPTWLETVAQ